MRTLISEEYGVFFTVKGPAATEDIDATAAVTEQKPLFGHEIQGERFEVVY
jgi:hypothetical protein